VSRERSGGGVTCPRIASARCPTQDGVRAWQLLQGRRRGSHRGHRGGCWASPLPLPDLLPRHTLPAKRRAVCASRPRLLAIRQCTMLKRRSGPRGAPAAAPSACAEDGRDRPQLVRPCAGETAAAAILVICGRSTLAASNAWESSSASASADGRGRVSGGMPASDVSELRAPRAWLDSERDSMRRSLPAESVKRTGGGGSGAATGRIQAMPQRAIAAAHADRLGVHLRFANTGSATYSRAGPAPSCPRNTACVTAAGSARSSARSAAAGLSWPLRTLSHGSAKPIKG
jgi:hypothetical protein